VAQRALRADAAANRERILAVAAVTVRRDGAAVPLATIAAEAGVGVATLYRSFPSREALLSALTHRSLEMVVAAASRAADSDTTALGAVERFLHQTIEHGNELVLPLHGGPVLLDQKTADLRAQVRTVLGGILDRGKRDGTVSADATAEDVVLFGALLAQALPHVRNWDAAARRQVTIFLAGLAQIGTHPA
jgi:AcrR family transcriptional regulator